MKKLKNMMKGKMGKMALIVGAIAVGVVFKDKIMKLVDTVKSKVGK